MTVLAVVVGMLVPFVTILATLVWAWRQGTLRETGQERYDRHFEQIVRRI